MADGGELVPPSQDARKEQIWFETKKRLERFLPALFAEIFPDAGNEKSAPVPGVPSPVVASAGEKASGEEKENEKEKKEEKVAEGVEGGSGAEGGDDEKGSSS